MYRALALVFISVAVGAVGVAPATAVTITYLDDLREIHADHIRRIFTGDGWEIRSATLEPSPDFSDFSTGVSFLFGAAWQVSLLGENGMWARGFARGEQDLLAVGNGNSLFHVAFAVDEVTSWRLSGTLEREAGPILHDNGGSAHVTLRMGATVIYSEALPPNPSNDPNSLTVPVLASGELSPGSYELIIEASAEELAQTLGTAFFDLAFVVPEPRAGVLLLAALVAARAARRRSLAQGGARP